MKLKPMMVCYDWRQKPPMESNIHIPSMCMHLSRETQMGPNLALNEDMNI